MASVNLDIEVIFSPRPGQVVCCQLQMQSGACLVDALHESGLLKKFPELQTAALSCGIWGRISALSTVLRDHDRVEIYRPLTIDPKDARRLRQQRSTAKCPSPADAAVPSCAVR
jgi:uncharacterized protein